MTEVAKHLKSFGRVDTPSYFGKELDPQIYETLSKEEHAFLVEATGLQADELRTFVLERQAQAYALYHYPCIRSLAFASPSLGLKAFRHPAYAHLLEQFKQDDKAVLLDVGCFFGSELRKAAIDGIPASRMIGTDLEQGFLDIGKEMYKHTDKQRGSPRFLAGDFFDDRFFDTSTSSSMNEDLNMDGLYSLAPLTGLVTTIFSSSFFHLFARDKQRLIAQRMIRLLKAASGSLVFGSHVGGFGGPGLFERTDPNLREEEIHRDRIWPKGGFESMWHEELRAAHGDDVRADVQVQYFSLKGSVIWQTHDDAWLMAYTVRLL
ncbi:uncharacterized protein L969DRAFT_47497 [Mixia osmundae IAM 14324]|uniref:Methyltransferase domain-containing protein n=1 Tax=Mixia osmundae (strain CBS 9802 / IAM 14324 / JCM 22182 / KY 12970) TaxID=764103 RepID=G7E9M3_MIXOS|nr:uncharacterized protein L969DRAFT_47497 [Mixia osmundae IAM 14324]KEI39972.1 hypothetical protein L969DRAFT_47497 [Mixia osmundae IAM 14324]GAA99342.1 hypothetical protein E5Q_06037 [Mixia osmundae IAM 14324]